MQIKESGVHVGRQDMESGRMCPACISGTSASPPQQHEIGNHANERSMSGNFSLLDYTLFAEICVSEGWNGRLVGQQSSSLLSGRHHHHHLHSHVIMMARFRSRIIKCFLRRQRSWVQSSNYPALSVRGTTGACTLLVSGQSYLMSPLRLRKATFQS